MRMLRRCRAMSIVSLLLLAACDSGGSSGAPGAAGGDTSAGGLDGGDTASKVAADGTITSGPWLGSGFTATDPGAATITPECSAGCMPPFVGTDFCMTGKVTGRPDYTGFAMLGWDVAGSGHRRHHRHRYQHAIDGRVAGPTSRHEPA